MSDPVNDDAPPFTGGPVDQVVAAIASDNRLELDPEIMRQFINDCEDHAIEMSDFADSARRRLRPDKLGFGEEHLSNSADLLRN
ncbi:hypothetical protein [Rhodococcus rhodnii]|nr:hypothetical protein [Rhodococcus rhodnii]